MIACGAFGALTVGNVKWVWWFFGMCWFLHIIFALGKSWAEAAKSRGGESGAVYSKLAGITVIVWFAYPIVWVFAEGFGNFSVTFEVRARARPHHATHQSPSESSRRRS
jgi:bacteriorhodopsin